MRLATFSLLIALAFCLPACGKKQEEQGASAAQPVAPVEEVYDAAPPPPREVSPEEASAAIYACWSAATEEARAGCRTEDARKVWHDAVPSGGDADVIAALRAAMPDLVVEPQLFVLNGSATASILLVTGTQTQALWGKEATDKKVAFLVGQVAQLHGAYRGDVFVTGVTREEIYFDQATVLSALGHRADKRAAKAASPFAQAVEVTTGNDPAQRMAFAHYNRGHLQALRAKDVDAIIASYTKEATVSYVPHAAAAKGTKAIRAHYAALLKEAPDYSSSIRRQWGAGDWIVAETLVGGTDKKSKRPWQANQLEFIQYQGDKIAQHFVFANELARSAQLGSFDPESLKAPVAAP